MLQDVRNILNDLHIVLYSKYSNSCSKRPPNPRRVCFCEQQDCLSSDKNSRNCDLFPSSSLPGFKVAWIYLLAKAGAARDDFIKFV